MKGIYTVYRFKDIAGNILYVGRSIDLRNRIRSHFSKNGHLPTDCYVETNEIDYIELDSEIDMIVHELVLINKYNPPYNSADRYEGETIIEVDDLNWEVYRNFLNEEIDEDRDRFIERIEEREQSRKEVLQEQLFKLKKHIFYAEVKGLNDTLSKGINNELVTSEEYSTVDLINNSYFVAYTSSKKQEVIVSGYKNNGIVAFKSSNSSDMRGGFYFYIDDDDLANEFSPIYSYLKNMYPTELERNSLVKNFTVKVTDHGEIIRIEKAPSMSILLLDMNAYHKVIQENDL